ncbi:hypothetical protein [Bacillus mycoides]|uniref:hypothetical protein n=1 Tax=Bacillus mycoides TaxID=1405 RepID=UPI001C032DA7|nr:hypothetical protein [Bacillus mycoides]QWG36679.1 hypothetical protein EXW30_28115 [Bacillus mycoides]
MYHNQITQVYDEFYTSLIMDDTYSEKILIRLIGWRAEYEITKGSYKIKLSAKNFNRRNPSLTAQWEKLQEEIIFIKK